MATSSKQRVAIVAIMIMMVVGTLGSFLVIILQNENQQTDAKKQQDAYAQYQKDSEAYQAEITELGKKYYPTLTKYSDQVAKFTADDVKSLSKKDLVTGSGKTIDESTQFSAYYIGWTPDGKIFDQSIEDKTLKAPFAINGLGTSSVIEGWKEGIKGMKIGGVRVLTIPSDKAYGEQGSGENIPANTPLKFIVLAIEETPQQPEIPQELLQGAY